MMRRYTLQIGEREFVVDVDELAADRFSVQVGGEVYDVALGGDEDLSKASITPQLALATGGSAGAAPARTATVARPKPAAVVTAVPTAAPAAKPRAGGGANTLTAPMPGVILEVHVKVGATVERGDDIATLEAMKMQNPIRAPRAGKIAEVFVAAGQSVGHGDAIVAFEA